MKPDFRIHGTIISVLLVCIFIDFSLSFEEENKEPKDTHHWKTDIESEGTCSIQNEACKGEVKKTFRSNVLGNFEPVEDEETKRPGDNGEPFYLDKDYEQNDKVNILRNEYGMNMIVSQHIPMDRKVPDLRLEECKYWHYPTDLPTASVVIVFHNEGFTTLLRTVHSVLLRSPKKFLREVLLVDDFSDKKDLKGDLDRYIKENFGQFNTNWKPEIFENPLEGENLNDKSGKVRLIRNEARQGLIRTRVRGAKEALGKVVVFLDAHCEVNKNWLVPLLASIAENSQTVAVPIIDGIDSETFQVRPVYANKEQHFRGIWDWGMFYKEMALDMKKHLKHHRVSEPYESPTHVSILIYYSYPQKYLTC